MLCTRSRDARSHLYCPKVIVQTHKIYQVHQSDVGCVLNLVLTHADCSQACPLYCGPCSESGKDQVERDGGAGYVTAVVRLWPALPRVDACAVPAGVLDVLRLAMETRKVMLVDIALDLVQKLIAHHHLAGPVHAIAHKRDAASAPRAARRKSHDDDDGAEAAPDGPMPPQVQ